MQIFLTLTLYPVFITLVLQSKLSQEESDSNSCMIGIAEVETANYRLFPSWIPCSSNPTRAEGPHIGVSHPNKSKNGVKFLISVNSKERQEEYSTYRRED